MKIAGRPRRILVLESDDSLFLNLVPFYILAGYTDTVFSSTTAVGDAFYDL